VKECGFQKKKMWHIVIAMKEVVDKKESIRKLVVSSEKNINRVMDTKICPTLAFSTYVTETLIDHHFPKKNKAKRWRMN